MNATEAKEKNEVTIFATFSSPNLESDFWWERLTDIFNQ